MLSFINISMDVSLKTRTLQDTKTQLGKEFVLEEGRMRMFFVITVLNTPHFITLMKVSFLVFETCGKEILLTCKTLEVLLGVQVPR